MTRQNQARALRNDCAVAQANVVYGTQRTNGDEGLYADYRGNYSKALPHNEIGEVDEAAYAQFLRALEAGDQNEFEAIPLGGTRKLVSPLAAERFELVGLDSHKTFMRPAHVFAGNETAAEMGELYWKALCRDIPFAAFQNEALIRDAIADLNGFAATVGAKSNGRLTPETIFRGETAGDLDGPYISQFLLRNIPYGGLTIEQRYAVPVAGQDYMTDVQSWLDVQNGVQPPAIRKSGRHYIHTARALGEYVHADYSYQAYLNAALILLSIPGSAFQDNIYNSSRTQAGFATLGGPDVLDLVAKAGNLSLTGAWYQKWLVHRRARPEAYAGRLHFQKTGQKDYGLPDDIVSSEGVRRIFAQNGTYLLPQAYPEGSPTHPSYPAGHATIAGACCTVLKAFFEESLQLFDNVQSNASGTDLVPYNAGLSVLGEINKLASNVALGRDWAGVHYRSDGIDGLLVGEQQAIGLLEDYSRTYREFFNGFTLTKFDGTVINIKKGVLV